MKSYIKSIGTAVPKYKNSQSSIADFMIEAGDLDEDESIKLKQLYRASGIGQRYSVLEDFSLKKGEYTFFPNTFSVQALPSLAERMKVYEREALPLALKAVQNCFDQQEKTVLSDITHLITISCSGMYAPGVDIELIEALGLSASIQRTSVNFMGCYAAFNGLKLADVICRADPSSKVLVVCVEICTIHYQKSKDWDQLLSNALFGDGAAAVLIESTPSPNKKNFSIDSFHCALEPSGKHDMAWRIRDFGFEMILTSYIPELIKGGIRTLTKKLLQQLSLETSEIAYFAIHPGGKKILSAIEEELSIDREKNKYAHQVLRNYGNMSSPTVLFVLKEILESLTKEDDAKSILSFAFGPGLTLESMLLKVHYSPILTEKVKTTHVLTSQQ